MKPWRDLQSIAIPDAMRRLKRDARGYPIPAVVMVGDDGKPDFRVNSVEKWMAFSLGRVCHMCGTSMAGRAVTFVGWPRSIRSRYFADGAMHHECAEYALQVCPFLAAPSFAYSRATPEVAGATVVINEAMPTNRPAYFGHLIATKYAIHNVPGHGLLLNAEGVIGVEWWKDGQRLEKEPEHAAF